jgi:hypothetical protein
LSIESRRGLPVVKPETIATLQDLEEVQWFHAVGQAEFQHALAVHSWMEAIAHCAGSKWEQVQHDAVYLFKQRALDARRHWSEEQRRSHDLQRIRQDIERSAAFNVGPGGEDGFPEWDRVREELKPSVVSLVERKTADVVRREGLPPVFVKTVTIDMLYLAVESEFCEVVPGGFFTANSFYYANGHFPCGWEGRFPEGRLIVF